MLYYLEGKMRAVIQRVKSASVKITDANPNYISGQIEEGLLVLLAIEASDTQEDIDWLAAKICSLRIFEDDFGKMNLSLSELKKDILLVSQFTLFGNVKKGSRPSFNRSAPAEFSKDLYLKFSSKLSEILCKDISKGVFGAMMEVSLINDGPVTIIIDTKNKEI